jgi:acetyl-CoA carboxylase biotin carboxyl carrier protein
MADEPLLSPEDVAEIIAVIDGTKYDSVDIQTKRVSVKLSRSGEGWTQDWKHASSLAEPIIPVASAAVTKSAATPDEPGVVSIRSALPGAFYRAPSPGAANFVEVGAQIEKDTIIGIIETMKVMSSIPAGIAGEIIEIIAENGVMVDKDGVLMRARVVEA